MSATGEDVRVSELVAKVAHYGDKYSNGSSSFVKPTRLEVWWTRTSSSYYVGDARVKWGCSGPECGVCGGGSQGGQYNDGPFTPVWSLGNTTYVYVYTSSSWPIWQNLPALPAWVKGMSDSTGYYNGQNRGAMHAEATLLP